MGPRPTPPPRANARQYTTPDTGRGTTTPTGTRPLLTLGPSRPSVVRRYRRSLPHPDKARRPVSLGPQPLCILVVGVGSWCRHRPFGIDSLTAQGSTRRCTHILSVAHGSHGYTDLTRMGWIPGGQVAFLYSIGCGLFASLFVSGSHVTAGSGIGVPSLIYHNKLRMGH